MPPIAFNGIRMLMAGIAMLPVFAFLRRRGVREPEPPAREKRQRLAGILCGLALFAASTLQQTGMVYTTAGKAGFISAMYVVLVPLAAWALFRRRPGAVVGIGVAMALPGLCLLCVPVGDFSLNCGDLWVLGSAFCYTAHILFVDRYSPGVDCVRLARDQMLVCGTVGIVASLLGGETVTWEGICEAAIPLLYAGLLSGAVAYTLQIVAQKETNPTVASLLMCLESVFAVLAGALILGERMSAREALGCAIMFAAVVLAQLGNTGKTENG